MEAAKKVYMDGTTSSSSYRMFGYQAGIGIGAKLYLIDLVNDQNFGMVLLTRIRLRSAPCELQKDEEPTETNVVSLKRAKAKAEADHRTIWGDISWEKTRDTYASVFVDRKVPVGLQQDLPAFLAGSSPEQEAKVAAEYLLSFTPEPYRIVSVDELAGEFLEAYTTVFDGLKKQVLANKVVASVEKENLGSFHLSTTALKKLQGEMQAAGLAGPDIVEDAEDVDVDVGLDAADEADHED